MELLLDELLMVVRLLLTMMVEKMESLLDELLLVVRLLAFYLHPQKVIESAIS